MCLFDQEEPPASSRPENPAKGGFATCLGAALLLAACGRQAAPAPEPSKSAEVSPSLAPRDQATWFSLYDDLERCEIDHRGTWIDLGGEASRGREAWKPHARASVALDGAEYAEIDASGASFAFYLRRPGPVVVGARAKSDSSDKWMVSVDRERVFSHEFLSRGLARTHFSTIGRKSVEAGLHVLSIAAPKSAKDATLVADWVYIGEGFANGETVGAATVEKLRYAKAALGAEPMRAVALAAPTTVSCWIDVPAGAHLRMGVGGDGTKEGRVEFRFRGAGRGTLGLANIDLKDGGRWQTIDIPMNGLGPGILEIGADQAKREGRILLGEAKLQSETISGSDLKASQGILVMLGSVDSFERQLPRTAALLRPDATRFMQHFPVGRFSVSEVTTMLTGVLPEQHLRQDRSSVLATGIRTLGASLVEAGVPSGLWSAVPTVAEGFGLEAGWSTFQFESPQSGAAGRLVEAAGAWLAEEQKAGRRAFGALYMRGAHPPWLVSKAKAQALVPADYVGPMEPRGAAQLLARMRSANQSLAPADAARASALEAEALVLQDEQLHAFISDLIVRRLWDSTLFILASDGAPGLGSKYDDALPIGATSPLWVHWPKSLSALHGREVLAATQSTSIARTIRHLLVDSDAKKKDSVGVELVLAADAGAASEPVTVRGGANTWVHWGAWWLREREDQLPRLCRDAVECEEPLLPDDAPVLLALHRRWLSMRASAASVEQKRAPADLPPETLSAMRTWGLFLPDQ